MPCNWFAKLAKPSKTTNSPSDSTIVSPKTRPASGLRTARYVQSSACVCRLVQISCDRRTGFDLSEADRGCWCRRLRYSLPANRMFDRFHLVERLNEHLTEVRRERHSCDGQHQSGHAVLRNVLLFLGHCWRRWDGQLVVAPPSFLARANSRLCS